MVKEFMNLAIREALIAYKKNEVPVNDDLIEGEYEDKDNEDDKKL